jgi:hypothetical protein
MKVKSVSDIQIGEKLFLDDMPFKFVGYKRKRLIGHRKASTFMCFKCIQLISILFNVVESGNGYHRKYTEAKEKK